MNILCASSVVQGREIFQQLGAVQLVDDEKITSSQLRDVNILVIRSKTPITAELLKNTSVGYVLTATAGYEHIDTQFLQKQNIAWFSAPGANAQSVAEYVLTALCQLAQLKNWQLSDKTLAVIGYGHVGQAVAHKAAVAGMKVLCHDPLLQHSQLHPLNHVLEQADIVTLHPALTTSGPFPSYRLVDSEFIAKCKSGVCLINTSRGEVADEKALLQAKLAGDIDELVLDVWDSEPDYNLKLLNHCQIATPHIAGYSYSARVQGTLSIFEQLCRLLDKQISCKDLRGEILRYAQDDGDAQGGGDTDTVKENIQDWQQMLCHCVSSVYDIGQDDRALRLGATLNPAQRAQHFQQLRKRYPYRKSFAEFSVGNVETVAHRNKLVQLGFNESYE